MTTLHQFEKFYCSVDNEDISNKGIISTSKGLLCVKHHHHSYCKQKESDCERWHD